MSFILKLPFRLLRWMLLRLLRSFRKKGVFYLTLIVVFMSIDMMFPALGGSVTTIVIVLGPAILMGLAFEVKKRLDGTMPEFIALSNFMAFAGVYALFRAWSKAADSSLPEVLGPLSRWIFGPLWNVLAGFVAVVFGQAQSVPMPVWSEMPLGEHLLALDPLLTGLSLLVLAWSASILYYGVRRFGGETKMTADQHKLAKNGLTPLWRANWALQGFWSNLLRIVRNSLGRPALAVDEMVIGFDAPPLRKPWAWPWQIVSRLVSRFWDTTFTPFDLRRMIVAKMSPGALIIGGAGAGKTLIQILWLMFSKSNKILIETQGNVFDKDQPLIRAAGRELLVISSDLGVNTVTLNVLANINPEHQDFRNQVLRISALIIQVRGEHATLERCTQELVSCIIGNVVYFGHVAQEEPRLDVVYDYLTDPNLTEELSFWANLGHPAFRKLCMTLIGRTSDPEFLNSLGAIYSPELGFLADPIKRAMVCGGGKTVFDPAEMLVNPKVDVAIQIAQSSIDTSGALLRLLLGALLEPRIQLTKDEAESTPAKGVTVWIDELAAFAGPTPRSGAPVLREIVDFHRQKVVRWVYSAQNIEQIERGWGEGIYGEWANAAAVRVIGKVGADPGLDQHITEVAGKTLSVRLEKIPGAGGGYRAYQRLFEEVDLLPSHVLSKLSVDQMVAFVRSDGPGVAKLKMWRPAFFKHPTLNRKFRNAKARFGGRPKSTEPGIYDNLLAEARAALAEQDQPRNIGDNDDEPPRDAA